MSFDLRYLREIPGDPMARFTQDLARKLSKFINRNEIDKLEDKEDIYSDGQNIETVVKSNNFNSQKIFSFSTEYFPPFEPDGEFLTCWIRGRNLGNTTKDISGFDNHGTLIGDPVLVNGAPFDYGIHSQECLSIARRMNRPTSDLENEEHIEVEDHTSIEVTGISIGVSFFIRFKIFDLAQQDDLDRTLFCKTDDITPNNGYQLRVTPDGRLVVIMLVGTDLDAKQTDAGVITADPDTVYEVWVTFAMSGDVMHIYVNNVDETLSNFTDPVVWQDNLTNKSLNIFRRGEGTDGGHTYGDIYDFMIYKEKVVSAAEIGYHYTNKWTIANIPFGQVMVTDYWATFTEQESSPSDTSFDSDSFTSDSFTTDTPPGGGESFTDTSFTDESFTTPP